MNTAGITKSGLARGLGVVCLVVAALWGPALHASGLAAFAPPVAGETAHVAAIVDGDTIRVTRNGSEAKVRLIGVDTPEVGQAGATEATAATSRLLSGQQVILVKDVSETDRYGRLLRYIYLPSGVFVNLELVKQGWARAVAYPPDTAHQVQFDEAQRQAIAKGLGRWAHAPTASRNANLRAGPATTHRQMGSVTAGQPLEIVGRTPASDWYQLVGGAWIAAFLVSNPPASVPVARSIPTPPQQPVATPVPTRAPQRSQPAIPVAQPQTQAPCSCSGPDLDCKDLGTHDAAQACYDYCVRTVGYDYHRLDGNDHDGQACESLP